MSHKIILAGPTQIARAKQVIDGAPKDAVVTIKEKKRTLEQNDKMWAMLSDVSISKPNGWLKTPARWKLVFMEALGHPTEYETGLNGNPFPIGHSSSKLTVSQMSDLIEFMYAWGSENDVVWTEPTAVERSAA